jgi:hypothetical protein
MCRLDGHDDERSPRATAIIVQGDVDDPTGFIRFRRFILAVRRIEAPEAEVDSGT